MTKDTRAAGLQAIVNCDAGSWKSVSALDGGKLEELPFTFDTEVDSRQGTVRVRRTDSDLDFYWRVDLAFMCQECSPPPVDCENEPIRSGQLVHN